MKDWFVKTYRKYQKLINETVSAKYKHWLEIEDLEDINFLEELNRFSFI